MKRINYMKIYMIIAYKIYPKRHYYFRLLFYAVYIMLLFWFLIQIYNTQPQTTGYSFIDNMNEQELEFFVKHLEEVIRRYK